MRLLAGHFGEDLVAVADSDGGVALFAVAHVAETNAGSGAAAGDVVDEVVAILDGSAIDGDDDVAGLDAGLVCRATGLDLLDQYAVLESVDAVDGAGEAGAERDADRAARHLVAGADEVVVDRDDGIRGHGESDALVAGGLRIDGGVDADDFAVHVEQRAAGVAGIDGCVGLDEVLELAGDAGLDGAVFGGDNAGGDGLREGEGAADGFNPVADLGLIGVAQLDRGQRRVGVDLDDGEIGGLVECRSRGQGGRGPGNRDRWRA